MKTSAASWVVDDCPDANGNYTVRFADGSPNGDTDQQPVATVYDDLRADMIAATPELLRALRNITAEFNSLLGEMDRDAYDSEESVIAAAEAAIAKATGASQL